MNKLFYRLFCSYKRLKSIEVDFNIITDTGYVIHTITEEIKPKEELIMIDKSYDIGGHFSCIKYIKDKYKDKLNSRAIELLDKYKNKDLIVARSSVFESGSYIVKCAYDIDLIWEEDISFEQYNKLKEFLHVF